MGQVSTTKESELARNTHVLRAKKHGEVRQRKKVREGGTLTSCRAERFGADVSGADGCGAGGCGADRHSEDSHGTRRRWDGLDAGSGTTTGAFAAATGAGIGVATGAFAVATGAELDVATGAGAEANTSASPINSWHMRLKLSVS